MSATDVMFLIYGIIVVLLTSEELLRGRRSGRSLWRQERDR